MLSVDGARPRVSASVRAGVLRPRRGFVALPRALRAAVAAGMQVHSIELAPGCEHVSGGCVHSASPSLARSKTPGGHIAVPDGSTSNTCV